MGIANISLVVSPWDAAEVEPADVVLSAHVIYAIEDIGAFVMKLAAHARKQVCMPTFMCPPRARYTPFWPRVHGEDRQELPGAAELMQVLWELGIYPNLEMYAPLPFRPFRDWHRALDALRSRLFVTPDTEQDARVHTPCASSSKRRPDISSKAYHPGGWPSLPGNLHQRYSPSRDDLPGFHGYEGDTLVRVCPAMMYTLSHYRTDTEATALATAPGGDATARRRCSPQDMTQ